MRFEADDHTAGMGLDLPRVKAGIESGPFPEQDGWRSLYHAFERLAPPGRALRAAICRYFWPTALERWRWGAVYRALGVHLFGAIIPTGGIVIRRLTRTRMAPYTLAGTSIGGTRAFYYKTCIFEALHIPFFLTLLGLTVHRFAIGRFDLGTQDAVINVVVNLYPMLHHRCTRTRIVKLLSKQRASRYLAGTTS